MPPTDHFQDIRTEMMLGDREPGHRQSRPSTTRWPPAGQCEIDMRYDTLVRMADNVMLVQVHRQERRPAARQDGHLHAQAAVRGQRLGHAHPPVPVEGRRRRCSSPGTATPGLSDMARWYIGGLLKHAPCDPGLHPPDDQQLQAAGAGLRGAGEPGLQPAQPLGGGAHPDVLEQAGKPSGSSSAARTRPAIRTWRSRRC